MVVVTLNWSWTYFQPDPIRYTKPVETPITLCGGWSFDWNDTTLLAIKLLPGLGDLHYPVTTSSTKAQEFFEQGLRLVYGFNHWEAAQAFQKLRSSIQTARWLTGEWHWLMDRTSMISIRRTVIELLSSLFKERLH